MPNKNQTKERLGLIGKNKQGSKMMIVKYDGSLDVIVKFIEYGNLMKTTWQQFKDGTVKNPYDRSVYGIGYLGEGNYKASINGNHTIQYRIWKSMLSRCYGNKENAYKECTVSEEWHNFQTFAKWFDENYYAIKNEKMNLDKDIIVKGNKVYSPETCVFVPQRINLLFIKSNDKRGNLPIGVSINKKTFKYVSSCCTGDKEYVTLGHYDSPNIAFSVYKSFKEKLIKQTAEEYKGRIPRNLYRILKSYKVEIDD